MNKLLILFGILLLSACTSPTKSPVVEHKTEPATSQEGAVTNFSDTVRPGVIPITYDDPDADAGVADAVYDPTTQTDEFIASTPGGIAGTDIDAPSYDAADGSANTVSYSPDGTPASGAASGRAGSTVGYDRDGAVGVTSGVYTTSAAKAAKSRVKDALGEDVWFVFYFPFDSSQLDEESTNQLARHAKFMLSNLEFKIRIEGHADERGSRSYNLALGERRARSVKDIFDLYQISDNRIDVISFGEEKPADPGHNESAWKKNRRAELIYY